MFPGQVKKYKSFSSKEEQIWVTEEKRIKAKKNNANKPSLVQRKSGNSREKRRTSYNWLVVFILKLGGL